MARRHGHEKESCWWSPLLPEPDVQGPSHQKAENWQGFQPLSSISETEMAQQFCLAKINNGHGSAFVGTGLFVGTHHWPLFPLVVTDVCQCSFYWRRKALPSFGKACHRNLRHLQTAENQIETSMERRQVRFEWKPRTKSRRNKLTGSNTWFLSKTVQWARQWMSQWY